MNKSLKRILIAAGILAVGGVTYRVVAGKQDHTEVTIEKSAYRSIIETVAASGKIQPESEVKIQSEVSGQIVELPVKEGDLVQKGQLLVKINPDLYTSAYNRAEAALNSSKSNLSSAKSRLAQAEAQFNVTNLNFQRQKKLFDDGAISKAELENITSQFETSKAEVEASQESIHSAQFAIESAMAGVNEAADNLKRTTILAPMTGTVTALNKELGETVLGNNMMSGDVIMNISALTFMEVNVEVNESDIVRVNLNDTALVEVDSYKNETFKGIITEIGNTALNAIGEQMNLNQVTNFSVKIRVLPESYAHLMEGKGENYSPFKPGMSATVDIITEKSDRALSVPIKAVAARDDTTSASILDKLNRESTESSTPDEPFTVVFVRNTSSDVAEIRVVKTGIQDDKYIQITEGIAENEEIITGPYEVVAQSLKPGDKLKIRSGNEQENTK
ncbi:MAG: efflux RND transporter periplasmic adaptor subunit [Flavobacteriales bacterium]|jgi:HlyD family secretion protein